MRAEIRLLIEEYKIDGGGLKNYSKTRWTTASDSVESVIHLEKVLKKIAEDNILTNDQINNIINQSKCANLGDCYLSLAKSAATIKKLPIHQQPEFRRYCFSIINKRFKEFDDDLYLLGYFLTPNFRKTIAKLCTFYNSNAKKELSYFANEMAEEELLKILKQTNSKTFEKTLKKEDFDKKILFNDYLESNSDSDSLSQKNNEENQTFEPEDYDWNPEDLLMADDD
ncbi:22297_t:CDS:2, partial [Gigaspora rosea]